MARVENILTTDPQRLDEVFASRRKGQMLLPDFVNLIIDDPMFQLCPFDIATSHWLRWVELRSRILDEAAALLSLPAREIVLDFQITERVGERVRGVFICFPFQKLAEYIAVLDKWRLIPRRILSPILVGMACAFEQHIAGEGRSVHLGFTDGKVELMVFRNRRCEIIRSLSIDDPEEMGEELIRSVRSVCARGPGKDVARLFFWETIHGHESVVYHLAGAFSLIPVAVAVPDVASIRLSAHGRCHLHLAKHYAFGNRTRQKLLWGINIILGVLVFMLVLQIQQGLVLEHKRRQVIASFSQADYEKAIALEKALKEAP